MVEKKKPTPGKPAGKASGAKPAPKKNVVAAVKKAATRAKAPAPKAPEKAPAPPASAEKPRRPARATRARTPVEPRPRVTGVHDLGPAPGSTHYRKRVGRGPGSGHGKTAGRGYKGQRSRTGYRHLRGFEGGQMPLHRRLPKRGFTNIFRIVYDVVNCGDLDRFEAGQKVTPAEFAAARLAHGRRPIKVLGDGEVQKALNVSAHKFSASAQAKIEKAGGRCEVIPR
jgi:large subunit ribosomal protein L15